MNSNKLKLNTDKTEVMPVGSASCLESVDSECANIGRNSALKHCPHKVLTLEELNPQFAVSTVFSKLDAKAGYWSVHLDPDSQLITTFRTPFGRYCWTRLAFGLRVSQDIFQARMDEILEDLPGVVGITDDVCVHGKYEEEHDRNLKALMDRAKETGLVFNSDKCTIRQHLLQRWHQT